jgi:hypothetical protein
MNAVVGEWWPYLVLILAGFLPNEIWRMVGLVLSRGIDEESELLVWVRAIATAVLAGVIGKLILFPSGALTAIPLGIRIAAAGFGLLAFFLTRRSVFAGVAIGEAVLVGAALMLGY